MSCLLDKPTRSHAFRSLVSLSTLFSPMLSFLCSATGEGHQKAHNFADFFPFDIVKKRTPVITMEEFMAAEVSE